jgi:hypothetical protein
MIRSEVRRAPSPRHSPQHLADAARPPQVHCQGGKGRTGTFCAALLLWTRFCSTADEALQAFARRRTDPRLDRRHLQGVDSPSQKRYVGYLERVVRGHDCAAPRRTLLTGVTLVSPPPAGRAAAARRGGGGPAAWVAFVVECFGSVQYDDGKRHGGAALPAADAGGGAEMCFLLEDAPMVAGDVTVRFFVFDEPPAPGQGAELGPGGRTARYGGAVGRQLCFATVHTSFHADGCVGFGRAEVDGAYNKPERVFPADFALELALDAGSADAPAAPPPPLPPKGPGLHRASSTPAGHGANGAGGRGHDRAPAGLGGASAVVGEGNGTAQANGGWVPYGLSVGRRLLRLHDAVRDIFAAACPMPIVFRCGECMWKDGEGDGGGARRLFLVVHGVGEYAPATKGERAQRINRGDSIARLQVGVGDDLMGQM